MGDSSATCYTAFSLEQVPSRDALPDPDESFSWQESPWYRNRDPVLGGTLGPGMNYTNHMPETAVQVSYNLGGWRHMAHTVENLGRVFRVIVLGDSFMEAYSV